MGDYYYQETFAVPGYALDDTKYPVSITENGQVITKSVINYKSAGTVKILKTDSETGAPLQGAEFTVYNERMAEVTEGTTDESGVVVFAGLPLGPYYCQETQAPPGYVPEGSIEQFYLDANGKVVTFSYTNKPARGSIKIIKKNSDGELLSGVVFTLYDADKHEIKTGTTDANGVLVFDGLPIGDYWYAETSELPGYIPDHNLMSARVGYHTAVDEHTFTNYKAHGHVRVIKSDENGAPLAGIHFKLTDEAGNLIDEGDTGTDGKLLFTMLPIGKYILKETATLNGYTLDETPIPIELSSDGDVVTKEITNTRNTESLKLIKKDAYENKPLAGAVYRLLDESGKKLAEGTADENGEIVFENLLYGNYRVQEISAPKGYAVDERAYTVTVPTENGTQTVTDLRRPGTLEVKKQDEKGKPLAGASFLLEYSTNNGMTWTPVTNRSGENITAGGCTSAALNAGQLTTDSTGSVSFTGLRADSTILYRLTETKAPQGYSLIGTELYKGTLPIETQKTNIEDSETVDGKTYCYSLYVTATDDPTYRLPETGGRGFDLLPLFMPICAIPFIIYLKRKEDRES